MKQLMLLVEESQASKEAKAKGLEYLSFGRYGKDGKQTHMVKNGRLIPIAAGGKTASGKPVTPQIPTGAAGATPLGIKPLRPLTSKEELENYWRDLFHASKGRLKKSVVDANIKKNPALKKPFQSLLGDYTKVDFDGNYIWPEMMPEDQPGEQEELENKILDAHEKMIEKRFGKKAAQQANYGNVADDKMYGTKVYTNKGPVYLATYIGKGGKLTHQWEDE